MSFTLSEDVKKELRVECMKEAYKHFKLIKTISDNTFYLYLSSQNLREYQAAGNNNGLEFRFPTEMVNHITDARIKVLDCKLPPILNVENKDNPKWFIALNGGILKRNNFICAGGGLDGGNESFYNNILASGIVENILVPDKLVPDSIGVGNGTMVLDNGNTIRSGDAIPVGTNIVGGYESNQIIGRKLHLDNGWRSCVNPGGKTATILFCKENITNNGSYDLTKQGGDPVSDWTMTLCVELLPDFMRNDRILN
jgi:hypothetical protein